MKMQTYIEAIDAYMETHRPRISCPDVHSLLDMLYCCYSQKNRMDTPKVKEMFHRLNAVLETLPADMEVQLFEITSMLCGQHRQDAFRDGLLVGFRLYNKMHKK